MDDRTLEMYIQTCYTGFELRWSPEKDAKLRLERGASFAELLGARVIAAMDHPSRAGQRVAFVEFRDYVWVVPFVSRGGLIFLKTAYPSRTHTKLWKGGRLT